MTSIQYGKRFTKFMIPIALCKKLSCQKPISIIKIKNMTRNSRKTNKLRYVNSIRRCSWNIPIQEWIGISKTPKGLNPSKALGSDELHHRVIKELAKELGPVFAHLFQQSINSSEIHKE